MTDHDLYFNWLVGRIDDGRARRYVSVLSDLFHTIFTYSVHRDKNRASEGVDLRYIYANEIGAPPNFWEDFMPVECTVLEMMVALAIKWDNSLSFDIEKGPRWSKWFWIMIENSGLDYFSDRRFDRYVVDGIIEQILNRTYKRNGEGGLFRTKDSSVDMRETELWYQLNYFVSDFL